MNEAMTRAERASKFFKSYLCYFIDGIVCIAYIATSIYNISESGKTILSIIADGLVAFLISYFIARTMDVQGLLNGERDPRVEATNELHGKKIVEIEPFLDKLDKWCEIKNVENVREQRIKMLASVGLKYTLYFDEDGIGQGFKRRQCNSRLEKNDERKKERMYYKCLRLKLTPLSTSALTSEGAKPNDPYNFGRTKEDYKKQNAGKDIISKVALGVLGGYFTVTMITDLSWALVVWKCLQVSIFLIMGVMKMMNSYLFIIDEYRGRIIKKINNIEKFQNYVGGIQNDKLEIKEEQ